MAFKKLNLQIGVPLDRFIKKKQDDFPYATGELSQLLRDIALAGKIVNMAIGKSGLLGIEGAMGKENVQGGGNNRNWTSSPISASFVLLNTEVRFLLSFLKKRLVSLNSTILMENM